MVSPERQILHVDMDAFYASVEEVDDPTLRDKPVLVGGKSRRGVVMAASYAARPFGVHSAMPMAQALRLCPQAVVLPPRMGRYAEVSTRVFEIFGRFTPLVEGLSLDEAFLDVTASRSLFGDGEAIARQIKKTIRTETGLTASAGVAPCKFVAKVASDLRKPDGLVVVPAGEVREFLAPLPIERMWGVGPKTAPKLKSLGLHTLGDLAKASASELELLMGSWGTQVRALARGEDDRLVDPGRAAVSIGAEETYEEDLVHRADIERTLLDHAGRVAQRMVLAGLSGRVVVVKLKYSDFSIRTRRVTLKQAVCDTLSIYEAAKKLLDRLELGGRGVRLTGVSVGNLSEQVPLSLFVDEVAEKRRKLEHIIHGVSERFGGAGLTRAELLFAPQTRRLPFVSR
jgi:DNA polymerase-4